MSTHASAAELALEGELTIYTAAQHREALLVWVRGTGTSAGAGVLDLSAVTDCDSAGVQLLLSTRHSFARDGRALELREPSQPVREALAGFGLTPALQPQGELA